MAPRSRRDTLANVAESAGVSVATVSKVLNGRDDVAPTTRALVQDLLHEHDYVARRVRPAPSPTIELLFHVQLNAYHTEVLQGVLEAAAEAGADVVVTLRPRGRRGAGSTRPAPWARELAGSGRRAAIAVTSELNAADLTALSRARLPIVVVDPLSLPSAQVTSVGSTNFAGGLAATQHLLDLGHREIAYLGGPATVVCNQARMHGYRGAMEAGGVPVPDGFVGTGRFSYEHGIAGGAALLDLPRPPTAVFAGSDETALGVIEAARVRGLRIPEDLSVVGFDDTPVARLAAPPLTTVRQPLREMGAVAVRTALRLAAGERVESHHVELATELVVRRSTAPPRPSPPASGRVGRRPR
jgi:LacI family transcriptional regulator